MCREAEPAQVTLVPDPPEALTSQAGFQVLQQRTLLEKAISELKRKNLRVSVFIENHLSLEELVLLKKLGCDRVELYTEEYADRFGETDQIKTTQKYASVAALATEVGLGLNAGHDLNLQNLKFFKDHIPNLLEVSIGHALISDALYFGFEATLQKYLECLK
jgi:pyridoxine 5-phosphate synthase